MLDDYHTGIRSVNDIKTAEEAFREIINENGEAAPDFNASDMQKALQSGKITVYSSNPIKNGVFVTPSRMQAEAYAGKGKVYSETVNIGDVAWIDYIEGQYAKVSDDAMFRIIERKVQTRLTGFSITWLPLRRWSPTTRPGRMTEYGRSRSKSRALPINLTHQ
jgi:hypothetical protein